MRGFWPIYKRELLSLFVTPIAWVVSAAFLLIEGLFFFFILGSYASQQDAVVGMGPAEAFFGGSAFFYFPLVLICPVLTMRLFAEERRSGTIEALLTAPVSAGGVVVGKYLATLSVYVAMWLPTLGYMALIGTYGELDWRVIATGYLGALLMGASYLAIGMLASSLTQSQLAAAVGASVFILFMFILGFTGNLTNDGPLPAIADHVSVASLMNDMSRGLVDSRRLVFWGSFTLLPIFATVRNVESWRWG